MVDNDNCHDCMQVWHGTKCHVVYNHDNYVSLRDYHVPVDLDSTMSCMLVWSIRHTGWQECRLPEVAEGCSLRLGPVFSRLGFFKFSRSGSFQKCVFFSLIFFQHSGELCSSGFFSCDPDCVSRVPGNYLEHSGKCLGARNVDVLGVFKKYTIFHDFRGSGILGQKKTPEWYH